MTPGTLYIGSDHAGFALKQTVIKHLRDQGWKMEDAGTHSPESADYPVYAHKVCKAVLETGHKGILICGSGIGMCMAANRHQGIRAALCTHETQANTCRTHNDANVLCLAERITAAPLALAMVDIFLSAEFEGGRHGRRVGLIEDL